MAVKGPESTSAEHRRAVHLTYVPPPADPMIPSPRSEPAPARLSAGEKFMLAAERVLGGWAPTLRRALMMLGIAICGLVVVALTAGIAIAGVVAVVLAGVAHSQR
ncbi:hypothetical protein [Actinokineospora xionganensis]|uniref:DUF3040 family protein n=1 Tax=Actinokineospora xionganensis TaxID=2684470 RepID=A0ABR7L9Q9_9PSEU|nr:hypothetical protein [Actinokineospora xionganensis]MBC6449136.1 hypothetical protein [Actinokineospora xionganensis]